MGTAKIILIDNYDSFVYNLYQYLCKLGAETDVFRNDDVPLNLEGYQGIIISPGPGRPENSGRCPLIVEKYAGKIPILGVCLGHQIIGHVFGAKITNARRIMHGKVSRILHDKEGIYRGIPNPTFAVRYHSLAIDSVPEDFVLSSKSEDEEIMGIRHKVLPIEGVQFHPESCMTSDGEAMLKNFINLCLSYRL